MPSFVIVVPAIVTPAPAVRLVMQVEQVRFGVAPPEDASGEDAVTLVTPEVHPEQLETVKAPIDTAPVDFVMMR